MSFKRSFPVMRLPLQRSLLFELFLTLAQDQKPRSEASGENLRESSNLPCRPKHERLLTEARRHHLRMSEADGKNGAQEFDR
jgi:hypothetical protein